MRTVSLRYFNVFGPRQDPASTYAAAIPRFITAYLRRERPQVFGDGRQSRDFTYVDNVVEANIAAAAAPKLSGESVNIAAGNPRTVLDVLEAISNEFGYSLPPAYAPDRPGDIRDSQADLTLSRELLMYEPTVAFPEGLRRTLDWYKESETKLTAKQKSGE